MNDHKIIDWCQYADSFQSVMPEEMIKLNKEAASLMKGRVTDFGCGSGKLLPYVLDEGNVDEYVGVDMSAEMVKGARWMSTQFPQKKSVFVQSSIESYNAQSLAHSAVSINSYYSWPNPVVILEHIFRQLKNNAIFVLATINDRVDMEALLEAAKKDQISNPHWDDFVKHNMDIMKSRDSNLVDLDCLIKQVQGVGFKVTEAHTKFYLGGLNYLILRKS